MNRQHTVKGWGGVGLCNFPPYLVVLLFPTISTKVYGMRASQEKLHFDFADYRVKLIQVFLEALISQPMR